MALIKGEVYVIIFRANWEHLPDCLKFYIQIDHSYTHIVMKELFLLIWYLRNDTKSNIANIVENLYRMCGKRPKKATFGLKNEYRDFTIKIVKD